ncbi:hypothetical protein ABZS79_29455 [Streptomyces griseoloalbus]|uniref:hypothetical protein n=1 Tax=Streptomyces griseoloalbus TaxID=67303 RepID=UPI0033BAA116
MTHLVPAAPQSPGASLVLVERQAVPIPHFGLTLSEERFHEFAERLRTVGVRFDVEPYRRCAGEPAEQWTMFFHDPAGKAQEFKSFRDESMVFAR